MKNIIIWSVFCSVLVVSCKGEGEKDEMQTFYQEIMKQMSLRSSEVFTDFFPSQFIDAGKVGWNPEVRNMCLYFSLFEYDRKKQIDSLEHVFSKKSIAAYQATDTNTIVVKRWEIRQKQKDWILYKDSIRNNRIYYPIPYFEKSEPFKIENASTPTNIYSNSTRCGLSGNYTIYVLDSKSGVYNWDLRPLYYMPEGWKNGYSKGVCINNKDGIIIYWVLVW